MESIKRGDFPKDPTIMVCWEHQVQASYGIVVPPACPPGAWSGRHAVRGLFLGPDRLTTLPCTMQTIPYIVAELGLVSEDVAQARAQDTEDGVPTMHWGADPFAAVGVLLADFPGACSPPRPSPCV